MALTERNTELDAKAHEAEAAGSRAAHGAHTRGAGEGDPGAPERVAERRAGAQDRGVPAGAHRRHCAGAPAHNPILTLALLLGCVPEICTGVTAQASPLIPYFYKPCF